MPYLTERQRQVLGFIERTIATRGVAPTLREIAEEFRFTSTASAQKHVGLLEKKGFLKRIKNQKRGLVVDARGDGDSSVRVPLLGVVAAGSPVEAVAQDETISVPPDMVGNGAHYVLKVRGESMIDDGIHDGDLVVVERVARAREGSMVVALVGGEVTLKRLFRHAGGRLRLQPANPAVPAIIVAEDQVEVQGAVVGLLRRY